MKFIHLSPREIKRFNSPKDLGDGPKPLGTLWFACGDVWEEYVASEMPDEKNYKYKYEADLDESKLLILKTVKQIKDFTEKYWLDVEGYPRLKSASIDWNRVRDETGKSGIYIPNAGLKKARKDYLWYYSFDICSVAIWDKDAILELRLISRSS
jgi:hypothetical protein